MEYQAFGSALTSTGFTLFLLFGPPGTGNLLVARELAKEAECRALAVSPFGVMGMVDVYPFYSRTDVNFVRYVGEEERSFFPRSKALSRGVYRRD